MTKRRPTAPGKVSYAKVSIYGANDAGRARRKHLRAFLHQKGIHESKLGRGARTYCHDDELKMVAHSHVDDFLVARRLDSPEVDELLAHMVKFLHQDWRFATSSAVA